MRVCHYSGAVPPPTAAGSTLLESSGTPLVGVCHCCVSSASLPRKSLGARPKSSGTPTVPPGPITVAPRTQFPFGRECAIPMLLIGCRLIEFTLRHFAV